MIDAHNECDSSQRIFLGSFLRTLSIIVLLLFTIQVSAQNRSNSRVNVLMIIADDMSLNAGIYGDHTIETPNIDSLGKDGVLFMNANCTASSCTPSRASMLTGRYPHQLEEGGNLWGSLPVKFSTYTKLLREKGYAIGLEGKGWGPGSYRAGGYSEDPAGKSYKGLKEFFEQVGPDKPFCFWVGSRDPHRPYESSLKSSTIIHENALQIPKWIPDNEEIRNDFRDYYAEVKRFDDRVGQCICLLKEKGLYDNTLIILSSDNGRPFPRTKANNYISSTNVPLIIRWGNHTNNGCIKQELISLVDLAPTILQATGVQPDQILSGGSLLPLLIEGKTDTRFDVVFTERERHAKVRAGNVSYPIRAIRTKDFLLINNLRPERWPAGDPESSESNGSFGDIDNGPTKNVIVDNRFNASYRNFARWNLEKRPFFELYDLMIDPGQLINLASNKKYANILKSLKSRLVEWRLQMKDPVGDSGPDVFDTYPYYTLKETQ